MGAENHGHPGFQLSGIEVTECRTWGQMITDQAREFGGSPYLALFYRKNLRKTVCIWLLWFSINFFYYGTIFLLPYWLAYLSEGAEKNSDGEIDLWSLLLPFLSELPTILFSYNLVERPSFGRK